MRISKASILALIVLAFSSPLFVYANQAHNQIVAMPEDKRSSVFFSLLANSSEKCTKVTKTFYQGSDKNGNAFWNAACYGGDSFLIQVNNDSKGSTRILSCKALNNIGGGICFTKLKS